MTKYLWWVVGWGVAALWVATGYVGFDIAHTSDGLGMFFLGGLIYWSVPLTLVLGAHLFGKSLEARSQ